jgi:hypothetical protein
MQSASDHEPGAVVSAGAAPNDLAARRTSTPARSEPDARTQPSTLRRTSILILAGAAAFAGAYALAPRGEDGSASELHSVPNDRAEVGTRAKYAPVPLAAPNRAEVPVQATADPFVAVSFVPPPPPAPPVVAAPLPPPPPAKAPPLPFVFVGLLEKGGGPKPAAFLARGDALLVVSAGDVVDHDYRIE